MKLSDQKMKILIDTDPGHDDAMALMLACRSPELAVVAVTTVAGNSTITNTTRNARFILTFLHREDIPVYSGAGKPLARELQQAVVHGKSGLEGIDPKNRSNLTHNAVEKIVEIVRANPHDITIVTLGPLTNIARAIQQDPATMRLVKRIVSMGGAINVPGNMNRVAEFNIFVDPEAADIVMRFPVAKTLVPLDACNHVLLQMEDIQGVTDPRLRRLLSRMVRPYIANLKKDAGVKAALMYDPLTIFYLLQPDACQTDFLNIQVETAGTITRGMTVSDRRAVPDNATPNAQVVTFIEPQAFINRFIAALNQ